MTQPWRGPFDAGLGAASADARSRSTSSKPFTWRCHARNSRRTPGMNQTIRLHPHQNNAIWRAMSAGNTLLACVADGRLPGIEPRRRKVRTVRRIRIDLRLQAQRVILTVNPAIFSGHGPVEEIARIELDAGLVGRHGQHAAGRRVAQDRGFDEFARLHRLAAADQDRSPAGVVETNSANNVAKLDMTIIRNALEDPRVVRLMTIPGIGPVVALTVLASIGDISRFEVELLLRVDAEGSPIRRSPCAPRRTRTSRCTSRSPSLARPRGSRPSPTPGSTPRRTAGPTPWNG